MIEPRFRPDVMLLAAGLGTRMRPLTDVTPKPLLKVAGQALLDRVVDEALAARLTTFVVNAHHHAQQVIDHVAILEARHPGTRFRVSREDEEALGTGGGVNQALSLLESDTILVMNTDAFWVLDKDMPIARMEARFAAGDAEIVLLCVHPRDARGFRRSHDFCLDPHGAITRDSGAPVIYAGVALAARSVFADAPSGPFSFSRLLEQAGARGSLFGVALNAPWLHVGDPEAIAEAEAVLRAVA
jgi:N-acetyl-alpha-D-muramate 1-phosphate uridylyltransferase